MDNKVFNALMIFCFCVGLAVWGIYELIDFFWIDDAIRSEHIITPHIELVIENNEVDTIYVYHKP
jgi:hypothetical protein